MLWTTMVMVADPGQIDPGVDEPVQFADVTVQECRHAVVTEPRELFGQVAGAGPPTVYRVDASLSPRAEGAQRPLPGQLLGGMFRRRDVVVPKGQPFATIVTKDYPGDDRSRLDRPDAFRVNVSAATSEFVDHIGREPREPATHDLDPSTPDMVIAHPVYGDLGWLAVVNPGERTEPVLRDLLRSAHDRARARYQRRAEHRPG